MKTFLINLDKNPDRLAASVRQLEALGVTFERIAAVYGRDLSEVEKRCAVNGFRWWCANGRKIRDGEIGCALSHVNVYRRMLDEHIDIACVLEDDNRYRDTFKSVVHEAERLMDPSLAQVVLLSNCSFDRAKSEDVQILPTNGDQWTSSYLITLPAAKAILAANYPIQVPADGWNRWVKRGLIELYHCFPTAVVQDGHPLFAYGIPLTTELDSDSDIEGGGVFRVKNLPLPLKILHKAKRLVGLSIDSLLPLGRAK